MRTWLKGMIDECMKALFLPLNGHLEVTWPGDHFCEGSPPPDVDRPLLLLLVLVLRSQWYEPQGAFFKDGLAQCEKALCLSLRYLGKEKDRTKKPFGLGGLNM